MSHSFQLQAQHHPDGVIYREVGLEFRAKKERTRWQVAVLRDDVVLGVDTINLSDAKARRALVRELKDLADEERTGTEAVLVALAVRLPADWEDQVAWLVARQQEQAEFVALQASRQQDEATDRRRASLDESTREQLEDPALLYRICDAVQAQGVIREERNLLLVYLAITSRITDAPISLFVKGESSGGKSHLVATVFTFFPAASHIDLTSVSEKGLIYDPRPYAHRTIVFFEAHGQGNEFVNYLIRTLISEGEIRHLTTVKDESGAMVGKEIVKPGPTNFITTTTAPEGHAENETRVWSILVDESAAATRGVLQLNARQSAGKFNPPPLDAWREVQEWLALGGETRVVVPFAEVLSDLVPDDPVRMRRDFKRLLHLVAVCAVLHQRQRGRDDQGRIVAELADYAMVYELVYESFGRVIRGITEKTLELVDGLRKVLEAKQRGAEEPETASYADLVAETGREKYYITRWLRPAVEIGLVENLETKRGKAASLRLGSFKLDERRALPAPQQVADALAAAFEWVDPLTGQRRIAMPDPDQPLHRSSVAEGDSSDVFSPDRDPDHLADAGGRARDNEPRQGETMLAQEGAVESETYPREFARTTEEVPPVLHVQPGSREKTEGLIPPATLQHRNADAQDPIPPPELPGEIEVGKREAGALLSPPTCGCPSPDIHSRRDPAGALVGFVCFGCMWRSDEPDLARTCSCPAPALRIHPPSQGFYCEACWGWRRDGAVCDDSDCRNAHHWWDDDTRHHAKEPRGWEPPVCPRQTPCALDHWDWSDGSRRHREQTIVESPS